jgi:hypothetical protein
MPTVGDLVAVAHVGNADVATHQLLERCSLDTGIDGDLHAVAAEVDAGLQAMAEERGIYLQLTCTECGRPSRHALEPAEFLWIEVVTAAAALLEEVHAIASAYGWAERDILAMTPQRRHAYLARATA